MSTTTDLTTLKINHLTQAQYDEAMENDEINENEIYMTPNTYNEIWVGTQAEYDLLTPDANTLYFIKES